MKGEMTTAASAALPALQRATTPEALWQLQGALLEAGFAPEAPALRVLGRFHSFLSELSASATSRQYSHFASLLDMGAVGGVALQNLLEVEGSADWWQQMLLGGLSESLMVLAARQYVKAWEQEMEAGYQAAAWYLYEELWRLSADLRPEQPPGERRQLLERLIAPLRQAGTGGAVKAALAARLFQLLLLAHLGRAREGSASNGTEEGA